MSEHTKRTETENVDGARLRVVAAAPISEELVSLVTTIEPRIDFVRDQTLLAPMRFPGDPTGPPGFARSEDEQRRYEQLVDTAEVLFGFPDESSTQLARTVNANPRLRWVHGMPAGAGSQLRSARLSDEQLARVTVTTSAGVHAKPLAEFALLGLLAGAKTLPRLERLKADSTWGERWQMRHLFQQTILVVGLGSIGREVASKLAALGVRVIGTSRREVSVEGVAEVIHPDRIAEVAPHVDGLVVTLPGTESTTGMISAAVLASLTPGATVVNVGRGTVIDEEALIAALQSGQVGFAALDVFAREPLAADSPLWSLPSVLISPHTAALNPDIDRDIATLFAENATRFLDGEPMVNVVDTVEFY
ncbi:D-2-hydroxyacid dehydrogenase [Agreia sp. COWG]|uniref:D-2-hydroxyacid dehydrogenase n=1 Tax=Agreia sp. COWG TaxID=2773266 RepID=UPI001929417A|nr:D-2-hydroxyacid dehydrogenase [Agreia sp. COWG]CAD6002444.1 D-3-phosphoglycerate dehydrogenase [Agreia sp. COWG]